MLNLKLSTRLVQFSTIRLLKVRLVFRALGRCLLLVGSYLSLHQVYSFYLIKKAHIFRNRLFSVSDILKKRSAALSFTSIAIVFITHNLNTKIKFT
jgi:hypothetical protein